MKHYTKIMNASLENLRQSMTNVSLDQFVVSTLESLMHLERDEYLAKIDHPDEKGNGHYQRAFRSLRRNQLTINIPRSRSGHFSPLTLELVKQGRDDLNDLCLTLYRKGMTSRDIGQVMQEYFGSSVSHTKVNQLAETFHKARCDGVEVIESVVVRF